MTREWHETAPGLLFEASVDSHGRYVISHSVASRRYVESTNAVAPWVNAPD